VNAALFSAPQNSMEHQAANATGCVHHSTGYGCGVHVVLRRVVKGKQSDPCLCTFTGDALSSKRGRVSVLLTAAHVVPSILEAQRTMVSFDDGEKRTWYRLDPSQLWGIDARSDVCVCAFRSVLPVPTIDYQKPDITEEGVVAVRNPPEGRRELKHGEIAMRSSSDQIFYHTVQTEPGWSGGPLLQAGHLIAIHVASNYLVRGHSEERLRESVSVVPTMDALLAHGFAPVNAGAGRGGSARTRSTPRRARRPRSSTSPRRPRSRRSRRGCVQRHRVRASRLQAPFQPP
jgi:hypothetical protein